MSNYYVRRSDHLEHGILGSNGNFAGNAIKSYKASGGTNPRSTVKSTNSGGRTWKNHLYKLKMIIGGKVRYFYNDAQIAAAKAGSALNRGAVKARANFENAVGISAKRGMNVNKQRYQNLSSGRNRRGADLAKKNAQKYERAYNKSLLGRIENVGSKARKIVGDSAAKARKAGSSFAGSIKDEAYKVAKDPKGAVKKAGKNIEKAAKSGASKADKALGVSAKKTLKSTRNTIMTQGKTSDAYKTQHAKIQKAQIDYDNSLIGRVDKLRGKRMVGGYTATLPDFEARANQEKRREIKSSKAGRRVNYKERRYKNKRHTK